jgi:4-hydroxyphenylpyruvate dioxygenase
MNWLPSAWQHYQHRIQRINDMSSETLVAASVAVADDFLPINGTDYIEIYCGNAKQSSYFYRAAFGFQLVAYAGPETGLRDRASYVLQQGKIRLVLTTPLHLDSAITEHIAWRFG